MKQEKALNQTTELKNNQAPEEVKTSNELGNNDKIREIRKHIEMKGEEYTDSEVEFLYRFVTQYERFEALPNDEPEYVEGMEEQELVGVGFGKGEIAVFENRFEVLNGDVIYHEDRVVPTAENLLNWFRTYREWAVFDSVRDILDLI